jgi:Icc protein
MHLFADTAGALAGMNCEAGLRDVLHEIQRHERDLDAILCTGDLSQDQSPASYQRLERALSELQTPQYWLAGNHDDLDGMHAALGPAHPCFSRAFSLPGWRVVLLDSHVVGEVQGWLAPSELAALAAELAHGDDKVLIALHHNPVPVAAHWLQRHALQNPEDLFALIDACPRVQVVLFGHIHHALECERKGVRYLGTPSTCVQFHPSSADFALDRQNPGYRWLDLGADGRFATGVRRVEHKRYAVDFSSSGY